MPMSLNNCNAYDHDVAWRVILWVFIIRAIFSLRRGILACRLLGLDFVPFLTLLLRRLQR
jgi:hypothetical protein